MDDLIARLRSATAGNDALDIGIARALAPRPFAPPRFTSSIEVAAGIVPDGHEWAVGVDLENGTAWATVGRACRDECFDDIRAVAATPALALVAAALQVRSTASDFNPSGGDDAG